MYESFFEFRQRPFAAAPQADRYFPARTIEASRQTLERCLARAEGTALIVGPAGVGKTLLCQKLSERFRTETTVAMPNLGGLSSRRAFLQGILFELGLPYRGLDEGELRLALVERLTGDATDRGMLLIVDGAHTLPLRLLEEIRMLADLARRGEPRVRLLLVGGPVLEERLAVPRLHALQQRITTRCYLESFDRSETGAYVRHQLSQAGGDPTRIFTEGALDAIFRATDGIPRLINQICDHALVLACAGGVKPIDVNGIEEAWADLQQLPTPWSQESLTGVKPLETATIEPAAPAAKPQAAATDERIILKSTAVDDVLELVPLAPLGAEHSPVEALDVIETHLAEWESEYTPVAKKEPEVELVLGGGRRDPFVEDFVEEEVVVDRYAAADRLNTAPRVSAYGSEAKILSALVEARRSIAPAMELRVAAEPIVEVNSQPIHPAIPEPVSRFAPARDADPVEPDDLMITASRTPGDAEMIIVEDDPRHDGGAVPEATLVRNRDYRQMFTRLRRGS
jgi:type II secretory pathway predicted ATPase ExeA